MFMTRDEINQKFIDAAFNGDIETTREALDQGAYVNHVENDRGQTALLWAAMNGNVNLAKLLIEKGAKVNARNKLGRNALQTANLYNHTETAEIIKQHGGNARNGGNAWY